MELKKSDTPFSSRQSQENLINGRGFEYFDSLGIIFYNHVKGGSKSRTKTSS